MTGKKKSKSTRLLKIKISNPIIYEQLRLRRTEDEVTDLNHCEHKITQVTHYLWPAKTHLPVPFKAISGEESRAELKEIDELSHGISKQLHHVLQDLVKQQSGRLVTKI